MRILRAIQERFGFTRNELLVVFLLTGTLLAGTVIRTLRTPPPFPVTMPDYTAADSVFAAGARALHEARNSAAGESRRQQATPVMPRAVDLNSATETDLVSLPGIGPALARRIIAYRTTHGRFRSAADLLHVRGIGPHTLARLRPLIQAGPRHR